MNSALLTKLEAIPLAGAHQKYRYQDVLRLSDDIRDSVFAMNIGLGIDAACIEIFDARHVPDALRDAYHLAFGRVASSETLYQHYSEILGKGPHSVSGFISCLKGKLAEIECAHQLNTDIPEYHWSLAQTANQPGWDIVGHSGSGSDIHIQVKMGGHSYVGPVAQRMHDDPHTLFAASSEIHNGIATNHPQLLHQIGSLGVSNYDFHTGVAHNLDILASNHGIDLPDSVGEILPFAREVILGIQLICDIIAVERDFSKVELSDRGRIHGLKALLLFSRFGISATCSILGAKLGTVTIHVPIVGTVVGAAAGAGVAWYLNKNLKPHLMEIAMGLFDLSEDEMFYLRNKLAIDRSAVSFANNTSRLTRQLSAASASDCTMK